MKNIGNIPKKALQRTKKALGTTACVLKILQTESPPSKIGKNIFLLSLKMKRHSM
jgi:hypothetical protein